MFKKIRNWMFTVVRKMKNKMKFNKLFYGVGFTDTQLLESLRTLRVHAEHNGVPCDQVGICANVRYYLETEHGCRVPGEVIIDVLCDLFKGWKHHSGNRVWPIIHMNGCGVWEGENFEQRLLLLDYTIDRLERRE